ncbi:MAG: hypothetical protein GY711_20260 [bacterium]|nr:hypothetical protein [bacterium]
MFDSLLKKLQLLVLAFLIAAGLFAWHGGTVALDRPAPWLAALGVLAVIEVVRLGLGRLFAFPTDEYGPLPDTEGRLERHLAKIEAIDRNRARRYKVQQKLRSRVGRALAADRLARAERHLAAADETFARWRAMRTPRREARALERRFFEDRKEVSSAKYENALRAGMERAQQLKTERGRKNAVGRVRELLQAGMADREADGGRLLRVGRELGIAASPKTSTDDVRVKGGAAPAAAVPRARWVPLGAPAEVHGHELRGGVWVGSHLPAIGGEGADPSLVDPELRVAAKPKAQDAPPPTARFVRYTELTPGARAAYLAWLAGGRRAPDAPGAWARLFLAALERRVLIDAEGGSVTSAELAAIHAELEALLVVYGADRRLATKLEELADYLVLRFPDAFAALVDSPPALVERPRSEPPMRLALALGRHAQARMPLSHGFARAWLHYASGGKLRAAARRCPAEFEALFRARYKDRFAPATDTGGLAGLVPRPGSPRLQVHYQPTNAGLAWRSFTAESDTLEANADAALELTAFADDCAAELGALSRHHSRDAGPADLATLATLPPVVLQLRDDPALEALRGLLDEIGEPTPSLAASRLLELWPCKQAGRPTKADCARYARLIGHLGWGVEPDVRFGGPTWRTGWELEPFALSTSAPAAPTAGYGAAAAVANLAAAVAAADGGAAHREEWGIIAHLESALELSPAERERLGAHFAWTLDHPPSLAGLARKLAPLDEAQRARIARFLLEIACADGAVSPDEVALLERAYGLLGLDPAGVHADLHGLSSGSEPRSASAGAVLALDPDVLSAKQAETAEVSDLLRDVFAEVGDEPAPATPLPSAPRRSYTGLDADHSALLDALGARTTWPREEVEELARGLGLLPDGALDTLNDVAFETLGDPLWEGDDAIEIDVDLASEWIGPGTSAGE